MSLVIRAGSAGPGLAEAVRNELRAIDPEQPVFNVTSVEALLATSVAERRFIMLIVAMFACVALIIASVGLYGVMSFAVVQRNREIGIRMALGAGKVTVLRMFVTRAGLLAGTGTLLGLGLSVGFVRVIGGLLYQTSATDPVTYAAICSLLFVIAMVAVYVPTRKAAGVDPTATLRYE
jgi:ABC-type antimicrobial peptide transport system permease subunit